MKNLLKNFSYGILMISILTTTLNIQIASATFTDVPESNSNFTAITYLQENGILNGYPDGNFYPYKAVNRAEFLKITMKGSNIPLTSEASAPFSDIDNNAWYAPYVKKAYAEGWIEGYGDGTFKPEKTINKAEALKILAKAQNWDVNTGIDEKPFEDTPLSAWYTKYVAHAKNHEYLEETGTTFEGAELMSRAKISEIVYRTIISGDIIISESTIIETTPEPPTQTISTPQAYSTISSTYYENITLNESLPNTFYKNEVYIIKGDVNKDYSTATIFLDPEDNDPNNYITFTGQISNNHFEIPVHFKNSGNYNLGMLPGDNGTTKLKSISVQNTLPLSSNDSTTTAVSNPTINFKNDTTFVEFTSPTASINKVTFSQNGNSVTYISRQNLNYIPVYFRDFKAFNEATVSYKIETAKTTNTKPLEISSPFVSTESKTFTAIEHSFDSILEDKISAAPPDFGSINNTVSFIGEVFVDTQLMAYVIQPDGFVHKTALYTTSPTITYYGSTTIAAHSDIQFGFTPSKPGRYIIEINDKEGLPILNHPIYIGNKIPLIPDFFDLNNRTFSSGSDSLSTMQSQLLNYINESRKIHGLTSIITTNELNNLAQGHAEDMAKNNFFSHVNPQNQTPDDRRIAAGIPTPVSENIARDVSVEFGHYGLMRSATHRDNILDENWTKVGLGFAKNAEGYLIITEEFSTPTLTEADMEKFKNELLTEINTLRNNSNSSSLNYNTTLESIGTYLNDKAIDENIVLDNSVFTEALNVYNVSGFTQALGRTFNVWPEILESILIEESTIITNSSWEKIGIDIQTDKTGIINAIVILNKTN